MYLDETQETDVIVEEKKEIVPDKEAIEKNKKEKEKKELEKIKRETQETLKRENKNSLNKAIINANKDLNSENISVPKSLLTMKTKQEQEQEQDSDNESTINTDNLAGNSSDYESDTESNSNYTLKIDTFKDDKIESELNIESLDNKDKEHNIDLVVHGFANAQDREKQNEFFKEIREAGKFKEISYYNKISTTDIINKLQNI
jgi:hypothetical protein